MLKLSMPPKPLLALLLVIWFAAPLPAATDGELEISVVDAESGESVPSRISLRRADGRRVPTRGWGLAPLGDHAYLDGPTLLGLRRGQYVFDLDPGPEYRTQSGHFEIDRDASDSERIEVQRFANLAEEGWTAADFATSRPTKDYDLLRRAMQLAEAPRTGHEWKKNAWRPLGKPRDQDDSASALWAEPRGAVWLIDATGSLAPADLPTPGRSSVEFLLAARERGFMVVASLTSWELPLWVAHDCLDAVLLVDGWASSNVGKGWTKRSKLSNEPRFQGATGPGRWREHVYHRILEAGVHLPPVAGSGSGLGGAPFGDARVYAHADAKDPQALWDAIRRGSVVVTNGPLLRPLIGGEPPGAAFQVPAGQQIELLISLNLATRDRVEYLEVIQNGEAVQMVRLSEWAAAGGKLPPVVFQESGWVLVRAVVQNDESYQLASSAPAFVESPAGPRSTPEARRFFASWLEEAAAKFGTGAASDYAAARAYWGD